jgi:hypothetical protein
VPPHRIRPVTDEPAESSWSQVVAARLGVPANVVAVWSQFAAPQVSSSPITGPLSCGDGGAPRGIRTPNRQFRSQPSSVPVRPAGPFASPLVLVNGHVAGTSRASVPARHAWLGRNVVAPGPAGIGRQPRAGWTPVSGAERRVTLQEVLGRRDRGLKPTTGANTMPRSCLATAGFDSPAKPTGRCPARVRRSSGLSSVLISPVRLRHRRVGVLAGDRRQSR